MTYKAAKYRGEHHFYRQLSLVNYFYGFILPSKDFGEKAQSRPKSGMVHGVLGAVCLAVTAAQGSENGFITVPNAPSADQTGPLPISPHARRAG